MREELERDYSSYADGDFSVLTKWISYSSDNPQHVPLITQFLLDIEHQTAVTTTLDSSFSTENPMDFFLREVGSKKSLSLRFLLSILGEDSEFKKNLSEYIDNFIALLSKNNIQEEECLTFIGKKKGGGERQQDDPSEACPPEITEFFTDKKHPLLSSAIFLKLLKLLSYTDLISIDNIYSRVVFILSDWLNSERLNAERSNATFLNIRRVLLGLNQDDLTFKADIEAEFSRIKSLHQIIKTTSENWEKLDSEKARNTFIYRFKRNNKSQLNDIFQLLIEQEKNSPDFPQETSLFNRLFMSNYSNENTTDRQIISCLVWHLKKANIPMDEAKEIINRFFKNNFENTSQEMESLIEEYYKNIDPQIYTPTSGMATTQGGARGRYAKERNQDTCLKTTLDATMNTFTKKERAVIFKRSIAKLQQQHGQQEQQGATAIACVVSGNTYDLLNVGDSTAILGRKNKTTGHVTFELINTTHNGNNSAEKKRLGKNKFNGTRLIVDPENPANRGLGASRLIGYTKYPDVSHEPDTYHGTIKAKDNEEVFIILASDGLSEADEYNVKTPGGFTEYLSQRVNDFRGNLQQLPECLIKKAIEDGSTDNITVAVIPLNTKNTQPSVTAIFDGNNGDEVSKALQENFQTTFEAEIDNQNQINEHLENLKKYRHIEGVRELVTILNDTTSTSDLILANYKKEFELIAVRIETHNAETLEKLKKETKEFRDDLNKQICALSDDFFDDYMADTILNDDNLIISVALLGNDQNNPNAVKAANELNKKLLLRDNIDAIANATFDPETYKTLSSETRLKNYGTSLFKASTAKRIEEQNGYKFLKQVLLIIAFIYSIPYRAHNHQWPWEKAGDVYLDRVRKELKPFDVETARSAKAA